MGLETKAKGSSFNVSPVLCSLEDYGFLCIYKCIYEKVKYKAGPWPWPWLWRTMVITFLTLTKLTAESWLIYWLLQKKPYKNRLVNQELLASEAGAILLATAQAVGEENDWIGRAREAGDTILAPTGHWLMQASVAGPAWISTSKIRHSRPLSKSDISVVCSNISLIPDGMSLRKK